MPRRNRRSILAACAALSTTGALASIGSAAAVGRNEPSSSYTEGHPEGWSSPHGNPANTHYLPLEGEFPEPETVAWRYGETGDVAIADGTVYIRTGEYDGYELHALDTATGEVEWTTAVPLGNGTTGFPPQLSGQTVFNGSIYVCGGDHVTALDTADGSVKWRREFEARAIGFTPPSGGPPTIPQPTVAFDSVYVVVDNTLHAFAADDGSTRWTQDAFEAPPDHSEDGSLPFRQYLVAVANGVVYASLKPNALGAVDARTGEKRWVATWDNADGTTIGGVYATGEAVYGYARKGIVVDRETQSVSTTEYRSRSWSSTELRAMAGTDDTTFHIVDDDEDRGLIAVDYHAGEQWTTSDRTDHWQWPIFTAGETVICRYSPIEEEPDSIFGLALEDGSTKWRLDFDDEEPHLRAVDERTLYVDRGNGLVALRPAGGNDEDDPEDGSGNGEDENGDEDGEGGNEDGDSPDDGEDESDEDGSGSEDGGDGKDGGDDTSNCECEAKDGGDAGNESNGAGGDDENGNSSDTGDDGTGSNNVSNEVSEDDEMPGFTGGAGLLGGGAALAWLRRKASVDQSTDVNEPAE